MLKIRTTLLFFAVSATLFGLLALPALANDKTPVKSEYTARLDTWLSTSLQITFTSDYTIYVPIVVKPANDLRITSLNYASWDETVTVKNNGPGLQSLDGWQIISVRGQQAYNFPTGITLAAGQTLRVHSGPNAFGSPPSDLFWATAFLWNNNGDKAELRDNQDVLRDTFCYLDGCP